MPVDSQKNYNLPLVRGNSDLRKDEQPITRPPEHRPASALLPKDSGLGGEKSAEKSAEKKPSPFKPSEGSAFKEVKI